MTAFNAVRFRVKPGREQDAQVRRAPHVVALSGGQGDLRISTRTASA